jgi:predicted dehydrogenase
MQTMNRRQFLGTTVAASTVYSLLPHTVLGANNRVNVGIIGLGRKGRYHFTRFSAMQDVSVMAVSDPDTAHMARGGPAQQHRDLRKLLELKELDAVVVATPNHWHALASIMAMQAGKHVYVEKPVSHSIWESRQMVKAARKYKRVCQAGTQQRSCSAPRAAARDIAAGKYGKVLWAHCSKLGSRQPIGKVTTAQQPPATCDYDLWAGPAPMTPIMRKQFHYDWHWQFNWGDGEMGNWAPHYVDDLRHILGWDDLPTNVVAAGGRFWDDNGDTPNMHIAMMEHRGVKVVIDIRNMSDPKGGTQGAVYLRSRGGNTIMCENGSIRIARGGGKGYDKNGETVAQYTGNGGSGHGRNFIKAVRAGDPSLLACDIEIGHQSTMMCHLANIAYRVGQKATVEEVRDALKGHEDAANTLQSMLPQLEHNQVDFAKMPFQLGPALAFDSDKEVFTGDHAAEANKLVRLESRKAFAVPETV